MKFLFGVVVSLICGKFFVIAHDAAHGSFAPSRAANNAIGRVSMAAAFHILDPWKYGHNYLHHGFTNLRDKDFVWRPLSKREYDSAHLTRRLLERIYRHHSGVGFCPYYLIEILFKRMLWPRPGAAGAKASGAVDFVVSYSMWSLVIIFLVFGKLLIDGRMDDEAAIAVNMICGFVGPLLYVCWAIGFVVFFNHTHPEIPWFASRDRWNHWDAQLHCTLYVQFLGISEFLLPSEVMNHVAHHVDTKIPVRHLRRAQEDFYRANPGLVKTTEWSSSMQHDIMSRCKLYDYGRNQWMDFNGDPTGPCLSPAPCEAAL